MNTVTDADGDEYEVHRLTNVVPWTSCANEFIKCSGISAAVSVYKRILLHSNCSKSSECRTEHAQRNVLARPLNRPDAKWAMRQVNVAVACQCFVQVMQ